MENLSLGIFLALLVGLFVLLFRAAMDEGREMQSCRDRGGVPIIQRGVAGVGCVPALPGGTP
jgi:hypothetical protein